jgi:hypothetical protein
MRCITLEGFWCYEGVQPGKALTRREMKTVAQSVFGIAKEETSKIRITIRLNTDIHMNAVYAPLVLIRYCSLLRHVSVPLNHHQAMSIQFYENCYTDFRDLYSSPSIIRIIKSRRMSSAGHVARMGEKRNAYRLLAKLERKNR